MVTSRYRIYGLTAVESNTARCSNTIAVPSG